MRSREEIDRDRRGTVIAGHSSETERLLLEVLLDIRELLDALSHHMVMVRTAVTKIESRTE